MKLYAKKGGHGHATTYVALIGSAEARRAGFIDSEGNSKEIVKVVDENARTITLMIQEEPPDDDEQAQ